MDTLNTSQKADKEMWESAAKAPRVLPKGHSTSVTPVEILPPASKLARLNMSGIEESDLKTVISPVRTLTLSSVERERAVGIPLGATKFGFVYPVLDVAENIEKLNLGDGENEQWAFLLMLGGFCYFDASDRVVGLTSFTTYASETTITLQGPLDATESALQEMTRQGRMANVTFFALKQQGRKTFGWVHGDELLDDAAIGSTGYPHGAVMYENDDGSVIYFRLVTPLTRKPAVMLTRKRYERLKVVVWAIPICATIVDMLIRLHTDHVNPSMRWVTIILNAVIYVGVGVLIPVLLFKLRLKTHRELQNAHPETDQRANVSSNEIRELSAALHMQSREKRRRGSKPRDRMRRERKGGGGTKMVAVESSSVRAVQDDGQKEVEPAAVHISVEETLADEAKHDPDAAALAESRGSPRLSAKSDNSEGGSPRLSGKSEYSWEDDESYRLVRTRAAAVIQFRRRLYLVRRRMQLDHKRERLTSFSKPIFITSVVAILGNMIVDIHFGANNVNPIIGDGIQWFLNFWWVILFLPCLAVLFVKDTRAPSPAFSLAHVVFLAQVVYPSMFKVAIFTSFFYWKVDSLLDSIGSAVGVDLTVLTDAITLGFQIVQMETLNAITMRTLKYITVPNTKTYLLFPLQFFNYFFITIFVAIRSITHGLKISWVVAQVVLGIWVFTKQSGLAMGIKYKLILWTRRKVAGLSFNIRVGLHARTPTLLKAMLIRRGILHKAAPEWDYATNTERQPTRKGDYAQMYREGNRTRRYAPLTDPNEDPVFRLQFLSTLAVQFDIAEISAMCLVPILVLLIQARDGFFTFQFTGLLVRPCENSALYYRWSIQLGINVLVRFVARRHLNRTARKTLLGKKTIHGISALCSRVVSGQKLISSSNVTPSALISDEMARQWKARLSEHDYEQTRRELSLANLSNYHLFFYRTMSTNYFFFVCAILYGLYAGVGIVRLAPNASAYSYYGSNYTAAFKTDVLQIANYTAFHNASHAPIGYANICEVAYSSPDEPAYQGCLTSLELGTLDRLPPQMVWEYVPPLLMYSTDHKLRDAFLESAGLNDLHDDGSDRMPGLCGDDPLVYNLGGFGDHVKSEPKVPELAGRPNVN